MPQILASMYEYVRNKPFLRYQAQSFPEYALLSAYNIEEQDFKLTVKIIPLAKVPADANIIASQNIFKIKVNGDQTQKLKSRIARHGNEDSLRSLLRFDCSMCSPPGFRIVASVASLKKWQPAKIDVKTAFLQAVKAERDLFVVPPTERTDRCNCLWLLLTSAYGLGNANEKWQVMSDQALHDICFCSSIVLSQLFYFKDHDGNIANVLAKNWLKLSMNF